MRSRILFALSALILATGLHAQKVSVSTNVLGYAAFGTLNADVSYAVSRRWSVIAGVKYNPFTFREGDAGRQFQLRQQSYSAGARFWPWHTWSGWWFASRLRYQEYNMGGLAGRDTQEGDRLGAGLYVGYTHMVTRHFNVDFGLGCWGGLDVYRKYSCPVCGMTVSQGRKGFVLPDDMMISLVYVF